MDAREYILYKTRELVDRFPQIKARYENDTLTGAHFVEVTPSSVFRLDDAYATWEDEVTSEFMNLYPHDGVCFISDDTFTGIENAECVFEGRLYTSISILPLMATVEPLDISVERITSIKTEIVKVTQNGQCCHIKYDNPAVATSSLTYNFAA